MCTRKSSVIDTLPNIREKHSMFGEIKNKGDLLIAYIKEPLKGSELNKFLFDKGVNLSYLVHRRESLEEQFLEITKNTD